MGRLPILYATLALVLFAVAVRSVAAGSDAPSPSPQPGSTSSAPAQGVPYASDSDPVRIADVRTESTVVHGGETATATIITTTNAAALTARVGTYLTSVPKVAPGVFAMTVRVPRLPWPSYHARLVLTAIRSDGATSQETVPIKIIY